MPIKTDKQFKNILNDRESGSTELFSKFLQLIIDNNISFNEFASMSKTLIQTFSDMVIIKSGIDKLLAINPSELSTSCKNILEQLHHSNYLIANKLKSILNSTSSIATFSNSKTIQYVINYIKPKKVIVFESQPVGEGKILASNLKVNNKLVNDNIGFELLNKGSIDVVVISCDSIIPEKGIVNKIGTNKLVEQANSLNIPVFVLTSTIKIVENIPEVHSNLLEFIKWSSNMIAITDET